MARLSSIVIPDIPQSRPPSAATGNGSRSRSPYALHREWLAERCEKDARRMACRAYSVPPNPVHLTLTPATADGLSRAVDEAHRRCTAFVNARARVAGRLFQRRFGCVAMDAAPHLAFNLVRARLCRKPRE
jgi:putative transposase